MNIKKLLTGIEETIATLETLPVRTKPEEELMNNLKRLLQEYRGSETL